MIRWICLCAREAWWYWRRDERSFVLQEQVTQYRVELDANFENVNEAFHRLASLAASAGPTGEEMYEAFQKFTAACERRGCATGSGPE